MTSIKKPDVPQQASITKGGFPTETLLKAIRVMKSTTGLGVKYCPRDRPLIAAVRKTSNILPFKSSSIELKLID